MALTHGARPTSAPSADECVLALIVSLWNWPIRLLAADGAAADPFGQFAPLGVAGVACAAFAWAWKDASEQRNKAQERERLANESLQKLIPVLIEMRVAVEKATDAGLAQAHASEALAEATKGMPNQETWYRLIDAANKTPRRTG